MPISLLSLSPAVTSIAALAAVLTDAILGEPARWHPLVGYGKLASRLERALNPASRNRRSESKHSGKHSGKQALGQRTLGLAAWACAVLPFVAFSWLLIRLLPTWAGLVVHIVLLWFALGGKSLAQHIAPIGAALEREDLAAARQLGGRVVSRDLSAANAGDIARAAVESALENGNDAVFGALFWFFIGGGPAALAFRLVNTLDAMWGYRTPSLRFFGWAAARIDDGANWAPARISAGIYCLLGETRQAWRCWRSQAPLWDSPNAGPVMAAGAGALGVLLGGPAMYHGALETRPALGCGRAPKATDVRRALRLVRAATWCWLCLATLVTCIAPAVARSSGLPSFFDTFSLLAHGFFSS